MANRIIQNQNDPELIKLLRASTVAYTKAKTWEISISYFFIFLSILYPISYLLIPDESIKLTLFGFSFFLSLIVEIITSSLNNNTSKGAIFKEEFDTSLFNLPWKSTLAKPDHSEVSEFSLQYKGKEIKDWYSCNLLPSIPHNISIAIFQHTNTSWDVGLRKKYSNWLKNILISYSIILISILVILNVDGLTWFFIAFSILSFYTHFLTLIRGHKSTIEKREVISKHLDEIIRNKQSITTEDLRDIQDEIFSTRIETSKVPNFFFKLYKKRMNAIAEDYIESTNRIYLS